MYFVKMSSLQLHLAIVIILLKTIIKGKFVSVEDDLLS